MTKERTIKKPPSTKGLSPKRRAATKAAVTQVVKERLDSGSYIPHHNNETRPASLKGIIYILGFCMMLGTAIILAAHGVI